ncbi:MAG: hypothetical protein Q7R96_06735 [Nanoarchaeota archaeon]|nr:hypothetical protein [Nanoarchaeota archaeon]
MYELVKAIVMSLALGVISIALVTTLWSYPLILAIALIIVSGWALSLHKQKSELILYIIVGIGGAIAETIPIYVGAWTYGQSQVVGIPIWLPPLWGLAGLVSKWFFEDITLYYKNNRQKNKQAN